MMTAIQLYHPQQQEHHHHLHPLQKGQEEQEQSDMDMMMITPLLDSLPYIDQIHPDYEAYALSLIDDEMQQQPFPPSSPPALSMTFSHLDIPHFLQNGRDDATTSLNREEYKQLVARNGQKRSEQDQPTSLHHYCQ